ncbi:MAG: TIGR02453 family protein [Bacteroidetes bacterium]|nr:TIGR02453 family protein [Bacteroidota bacterium]
MPLTLDLPPFPGFRDAAFDFLRDLTQNNRRDWFKPRKQTFKDEVEWPMQCLLADAARRMTDEGLPLTADPKKSMFRIYRDMRFAKNKKPYKTHVGAVLSRSGSRKDDGVVYIHVEPGQSFLGAGFYRPDNADLRPIRNRMARLPAAFLTVVSHLEDRGLELDTTESLKRMPRGFSKYSDRDWADYLRWKSFLVRRPVADDALRTPDFTEDVLQMARDVLPLLEYGWTAIGTPAERDAA